MAFTSPLNEEITFSDVSVNGLVEFKSPQLDVDIRFSWESLAGLQAQWGEDFLSKAASGMDSLQIEDLAVIVAAASDVTEAHVMETCPPILPLSNACKLAWSYAWNGGEPPEEKSEPEKKPARLTLFGWRLRAPFERG
ncbi:MAG: hypothetical protein AAFP81_00790 [Pseudomonadota bacterium]